MKHVWAADRERVRTVAFMLNSLAEVLDSTEDPEIDKFVERIKALSLDMNTFDAKCRSYQLSPADVERYHREGIQGL